jgi:hypothetical protein
MRVSVLLCGLLMGVSLLGSAPRAQPAVSFDSGQFRALLRELDRRDQGGECKYLNDFIDRNLRKTGIAGAAARELAAESLLHPPSAPVRKGMRCPYHDRKASLGVAIDYFWRAAEELGGVFQAIRAQVWLAAALGPSWRVKLADAAVLPATQDLVALNLSCIGRDGGRAAAFWDWFFPGQNERSRKSFDADLAVSGDPVMCTGFTEPPTIESACYWNVVTTDLALRSQEPVLSHAMRRLRAVMDVSPRGALLTESLFAFAEQSHYGLDDPPVAIQWRSEMQKLIAEACAATLSANTMEALKRRAAKRPADSVEALIARFR